MCVVLLGDVGVAGIAEGVWVWLVLLKECGCGWYCLGMWVLLVLLCGCVWSCLGVADIAWSEYNQLEWSSVLLTVVSTYL